MISKKVFYILIAVELVISVVFFKIAEIWPVYSLDMFYFALCYTFANILAVNRIFGIVQNGRYKNGYWVMVGILIVMPVLRLFSF